MKEFYVYKKNDLIMAINSVKKYPDEQINIALEKLTSDKHEIITDRFGRTGYLINIGEYYMFQPIELENENISMYERTHPLDYKREKFGSILDLIPICDNVTKLTSLCFHCKNGTKAVFTHRITNESEQKVIGSNNYIPLCRKCYSNA